MITIKAYPQGGTVTIINSTGGEVELQVWDKFVRENIRGGRGLVYPELSYKQVNRVAEALHKLLSENVKGEKVAALEILT